MTRDVPIKDLRPLAAWRDELGLDRLKADLINGDLDAWWYDHDTGEYHQIPRAHWQREKVVERAIGWGWVIGGLFSPGRRCAIHAARSIKHTGGPKPKYDWEACMIEAARFVQTERYIQTKPSKKRAVLTDHLSDWFASSKSAPQPHGSQKARKKIFGRQPSYRPKSAAKVKEHVGILGPDRIGR